MAAMSMAAARRRQVERTSFMKSACGRRRNASPSAALRSGFSSDERHRPRGGPLVRSALSIDPVECFLSISGGLGQVCPDDDADVLG
jgi:hypothetical protein